MNVKFSSPAGLGGILNPPADKSITHRALMLAAVSEGTSWVNNPLETGDCLSTRACLGALGVNMELKSSRRGKPETPALKIEGAGLCGLEEPRRFLAAGNSGSTVRLLSGLLAGQNLYAVFDGDASLGARPMLRVVEPLRAMGAAIHGRQGGPYLPLTFLPGQGSLQPIDYSLTVPSAQHFHRLTAPCAGDRTGHGNTVIVFRGDRASRQSLRSFNGKPVVQFRYRSAQSGDKLRRRPNPVALFDPELLGAPHRSNSFSKCP